MMTLTTLTKAQRPNIDVKKEIAHVMDLCKSISRHNSSWSFFWNSDHRCLYHSIVVENVLRENAMRKDSLCSHLV